jgi:cell division protein FtsB
MGKHEQNAIIYLLCVVIGILLVLLFFFLLEGMKMDARLNHSRKEHDKSALVLREQREKMERLLKQLKEKENDGS